MADARGGKPTKRNTLMQDHEVYMQKIRLGAFEKLATDSILAGAGTSANPVECSTVEDQKFLVFWLKSAVTGKTTIGLQVNLDCATALSLYDTAVEGNITIPAATNPRNPVGVQANYTFSGADARVQGQGAGVGSYMQFYNGTMHASCGHIFGIVSEVSVGGTSFAWGAATPHALYYGRVSGGDAAARRKYKNFFALDAEEGNMAAQYMVSNADPTTAGVAAGIQVCVNDTQYWLALYTIA
jgi:hypothetical protein